MSDINENIDSLETNLIGVVNDLRVSTEIILKELTGYLNVSAHDLTEIRSTTARLESLLDNVKDNLRKLDGIENKLIEIPGTLRENNDLMQTNLKKGFAQSRANDTKLAQYIASQLKKSNDSFVEKYSKIEDIEYRLKSLETTFMSTKEELLKSQEGLYKIIDNLVSNRASIEKAQVSVQSTKITSEAEIKKQKILFWSKVVGILLGSGGILTLLITNIINAL